MHPLVPSQLTKHMDPPNALVGLCASHRLGKYYLRFWNIILENWQYHFQVIMYYKNSTHNNCQSFLSKELQSV